MNKNRTFKKRDAFHYFVTLIAVLLFFVAVCIGVWFFIFYRTHEETNDAQVEQYITPIMSRVSGYVKEVRFEENQFVNEGDTLLVLDEREYKALLDMAAADLMHTQHKRFVLDADLAISQNNIAIQKAKMAEISAHYNNAEKEYSRYRRLLDEDATTGQKWEEVESTFETWKARLDEIRHATKKAELEVAEQIAQLHMVSSEIDAKKAAFDHALLYDGYTIIRAPYDGWVGRRTIQPGQLIKEGQSIVSVVSKEKWVTANFKETQLRYMHLGQKVSIVADALGNKKIYGYIESFSPASGAKFSLLPPDNATGNFVKIEQRIPVKIKLREQDSLVQFLRAGMNVTVVADHE